MSRTYWLNDDPKKVAMKLMEHHGQWSVWGSQPIAQAWVRNTIAYYSTILDPASWDTSLVYEGEQGELVKMSVPQARALIRQLITLVTKEKLSFNCVAENSSRDVVETMRLGNALINQIVEQQELDIKREILAEQTFITGMSFIKTCWRTDKGRPRTRGENGEILYEGGLEISTPSVFDVFFDYTISNWDDLDWAEVRTVKSRWSLIAQFPELEKEILALPKMRDWRGPNASINQIGEDDNVYVYEFYHKQTPALPDGRMLMYGSATAIFHDGINEYEAIPIECIKPEPIQGMGFGYPIFSNLLPSQEMLDHSFSAIATNQSAFAVQNISIPRGAGISVQDIGGMNYLSYTPQNVPGGGKPESLQLTQSSPETFKFIDLLRANMEQIGMISPAMRGNPPPGVTSGTAIATLTTNSLEFISSFSKQIQLALQKSMKHAITAYQKFAVTEHMINLVGKNFQNYNKDFVGTDLDPIKAVRINASNPAMNTLSGRMDLAEKLVQSGLIKDVQQYISILNGEPLEQLTKNELSENDLIANEAEALMEGRPVQALSTDDHPRHVQQHASLLNNTEVRLNNEKVSNILAHIEEHYQLAQTTDPMLMAMVRTGKMPEQQPMGQAPGLPPTQGEASQEAQPAEPADDLLGRQ